LKKAIIDVQIGDVVKAIDSNGKIIKSEVVSIMHKNSEEFGTYFLRFFKFFINFFSNLKPNFTILSAQTVNQSHLQLDI
jgi:hypothetical protein